MKPDEIKEILEKHKRWLDESDGWSEEDRADLREANLYGADLREAILRGADLCGANLCEANLREANLRGANLYGADLRGANLYGANLYGANLCEANLREANLRGANLCGANLYGADLREANLYGANLREADLREANLRRANLYGADLREANLYGANLRGADLRGAKNMPFIPYACPDFGIFIGFKKASGHIVVLEIPEEAKRLSATGRKCRCNMAKVLEIQNIDGTKADIKSIASDYDKNFAYRVGETVKVDDFDDDRWNECSTGIHFFINRQEAVEYD